MLDLPLGGTVIPKEEIKRAPLLKIEVILHRKRLDCFRLLKDMLFLKILHFKLMLADSLVHEETRVMVALS